MNKDGKRTVEPGEYTVDIGGSQTPTYSVSVTIPARYDNPPYEHTAPQVR